MTEARPLDGRLTAINGAVVRARVLRGLALGEGVRVGPSGLLGEVISLAGEEATVQVYEETAGLKVDDPLSGTGAPLEVELGPGLLGTVFDGVQRPLAALAAAEGDLLGRGSTAPPLDRTRTWSFEPAVRPGSQVGPGDVLGRVPEQPGFVHLVLVPPGSGGRVLEVEAGRHPVDHVVARLGGPDGRVRACRLFHRWQVRRPRPVLRRLGRAAPLVTGQRILDTFFPLPRGGTAGLPGGFGTGKTILQQQLVKWAHADVVVFVGCGERGNEMTHMLRELPALTDPRTDRPLAERTVLVANTSNMPVSAREASLYTGLTIAEYFRDMGLEVALLADSTSRWAEALREISGRLGEMPAEEGYPPYLSSRLAAFYERAGAVETQGGRRGSLTLISAVSPPGGDLTEPVTRHTQSFTGTFWSLDKARAEARMFPAVSVTGSYGEVTEGLLSWWADVDPAWADRRARALTLLDEAAGLERTARLVGVESLPEPQKLTLRLAAVLEEGFLRQNAFDPVDAYCAPARQARLLGLVLRLCEGARAAVEAGVPAQAVSALPVLARLERARTLPDAALDGLEGEIDAALAGLPPAGAATTAAHAGAADEP